MNDNVTARPSTPGLFAEALSQMTTLFETEIRLVRTEVSEKISQAINAIIILVVAAVLLLAALILLLDGLVQYIIYKGFQPFVAYSMVGGGLAVIGVIAVLLSLRWLSPKNLTPNRTMTQLGKDARAVKEQVR